MAVVLPGGCLLLKNRSTRVTKGDCIGSMMPLGCLRQNCRFFGCPKARVCRLATGRRMPRMMDQQEPGRWGQERCPHFSQHLQSWRLQGQLWLGCQVFIVMTVAKPHEGWAELRAMELLLGLATACPNKGLGWQRIGTQSAKSARTDSGSKSHEHVGVLLSGGGSQ
jgi:hypothetical protein